MGARTALAVLISLVSSFVNAHAAGRLSLGVSEHQAKFGFPRLVENVFISNFSPHPNSMSSGSDALDLTFLERAVFIESCALSRGMSLNPFFGKAGHSR